MPHLPATREALDAMLSELSPQQRALVSDGLSRLREVRTKRFARATRSSYRYWCDRYAHWLAHPEARNRPEWRSLPALSDIEATPVPVNEQALLLFLDDLMFDPEADECGTLHAPGTLSSVVSAVSAAAREVDMPWSPSSYFTETMSGMRRTLAEHHRVDRAVPVTLRELRPVCEMLHCYLSPTARRDLAVIELTRLGLGQAAIAGLTVSSVLWPDGSVSVRTAAENEAVFKAGGHVGLPSVVDRTGRLWTLDEVAATAVRTAMGLCAGGAGDSPLLELTASNRRSHVRSILMRAASEADISGWVPGKGLRMPVYRAMIEAVGSSGRGHAKAVRDRALILVGWAGALRRSEMCALELGDVEFRRDGVHLTIRSSKTDQFAAGTVLPLRSGRSVATDPVSALGAWISVVDPDGSAPRDSPLFQSLDRHGNLVAGERNPSGRRRTELRTGRLRGEDVQDILRERLVEAGVCSADMVAGFSGHSLRRGFITEAASQGHDAIAISKQSRHKTLSIVAQYVDDARALEQSVAGKLGL